MANYRAGKPDRRGNNLDRARRKRWMLNTFGDGVHCKCVHCSQTLDYNTVEADRIGPGGSYAHSNIQPSCRSCNARRSDNPYWIYSY